MEEHEHNRRVQPGVIDTAIVGGGVAGLSAALFLARAGRSTTVYDAGRSRILAVERVREYVGFDGWTPGQMLARAREEALHYGASIRRATVEKIEPRQDGLFDVWTSEGLASARTVVLATGLIDELPPLKGLRDVWARDLHICPCFDGHEVRNQRFVVFGLPERLPLSLSPENTFFANYYGLPAVSIPCGFDQHGLPLGLQIVGKPWNEGAVVRLADHFQTATVFGQTHPAE